MNYFELFEIPVQLRVDASLLKQKFFSLSKKYHPDYFTDAVEEKQEEALEKSAMLNKAWKTFLDPDLTIKYVLTEKGLLEEEEKYELPASFLAEVMDLNETLMDDEKEKDADLEKRVKELEEEIYGEVKDIVENYSEKDGTETELLRVKEYYYKKKYLDRIRKQLKS